MNEKLDRLIGTLLILLLSFVILFVLPIAIIGLIVSILSAFNI